MGLDTLISRPYNSFYIIAYARLSGNLCKWEILKTLKRMQVDFKIIEHWYKEVRVAFKIIENWCKDHLISINPTEMVIFTRNGMKMELQPSELLKTKLNFATGVKYLGFTFNSKLT